MDDLSHSTKFNLRDHLRPARYPDPAEAGQEAHIYAACSVETFRAAGSLNASHRDAGGFLDQVDAHTTPDFWRRDTGVQSCSFQRHPDAPSNGDMDAVRVFYHSGHGAMDNIGRFRLPMGGIAPGGDATLVSTGMRFGSDRLRYLFWSASESLCVNDGHSPDRSWSLAARGLRMMFGFDGAAWDCAQHGAGFWRHWRMGKSLSQAWLDGASDISAEQVPVVLAMGQDASSAANQLYGENRFHQGRGGDAWLWRWRQPVAQHRRAPNDQWPTHCHRLRLVPVACDRALSDAVLASLGLALDDTQDTAEIALPEMRFLRSAEGAVLLELAPTVRGRSGKVALQRRALVARALSALRRYGFLRAGHDLCFDRIALGMSAGMVLRGGRSLPEAVDEIVVTFRQVIDGVPVLTPGTGEIRVHLRPDGGVLRIEARLRRVAALVAVVRPQVSDWDIPLILAQQSARLMRELAARGAAPLVVSVLPGLTEIGYGIRNNTARLVARQGIEIRCARGFRKSHWIETELSD